MNSLGDTPRRPLIKILSPDADQVLIVANPSSGSRAGRPVVHQLRGLLQDAGFTVTVLEGRDGLPAAARRANESGRLRAVVAAGGDGTAAATVNATEPGVPIAVLPLGTENLLAKYLRVGTDPAGVCEIIRQGVTVRLDVGRAADRIFLLMAGCGFDAEVVHRLHTCRRGHITRLSYAKPFLQSMRSYECPKLTVHCEVARDGQAEQEVIHARWVFVVNLPRYAGGLRLAPDAVATDGLLDVCTFQKGSKWSALRYLGGVLAGRHPKWKDCSMIRARRLRVEAEAEAVYQLDGDPGGKLPVSIDVVPGRLTQLVSRQWATKQGIRVSSEDCVSSEDMGETS